MATEKLDLVPARASGSLTVPAVIATAGKRASRRFIEFFTANIRNKNTRAAYGRAVGAFLAWCDAEAGMALDMIEPVVVAAYVEKLLKDGLSKPTVKQHLAAIRMLFDWMVTGGVLPFNPAASVRGPKYVIKKGKTPVLTPEEARLLLDSIDVAEISGLRDRALIAVMVYSFARVSAVVGMNVEDYYQQGKRCWLRLQEKGGKQHEVPVHHKAEEYLDAYIKAAGIAERKRHAAVAQHDERARLRRRPDEPRGRVPDDPAALPARGARRRRQLPHFPGDGDYRLSAERRHDRKRAGDRRA